MHFASELWDEIDDFFEDLWEHLTDKKRTKPIQERQAVINGTLLTVRPAYIFAERIDNLVKIVFGVSIMISAVTATFLGFQTLSDLLAVLINSLWGRTIMFFIGSSYLLIALWKILHLNKKQ